MSFKEPMPASESEPRARVAVVVLGQLWVVLVTAELVEPATTLQHHCPGLWF